MAEISADLISAAHSWLRISTTSADDEIKQTVAACLIDLKNGGVAVIDVTDAAIRQAIKLYLKAQFGYDDKADKFAQAYEFLKRSLALSGDYNEVTT